MKKALLFFLALPFFAAARPDTTAANKASLPYYIELKTDVMTDKEYATGSKVLECMDEKNTKGFFVSLSWSNDKGKIKYIGLTVYSDGIGACVENDELIVLFTDGSKRVLKSWNEFNCKGRSYFDLKSKEFDTLGVKQVKAVRFSNGRSYESLTYEVPAKEQNFFIEAKEAIEQKRFVPAKP